MKKVKLYPVPGVFIPGEPATEREETPEKAAELLAYRPAAFTDQPPGPPQREPDQHPKE